MSYFWPDTWPIRVIANEEGAPLAFFWRGRRHRVEAITNAWRFDDEWWTERIWRHYFKVTTDTRLLVVLYQDLCRGNWFLYRVYD